MEQVDPYELVAGHEDPLLAHDVDPARVLRAWVRGRAAVVELPQDRVDAPVGARSVLAVGPAADLDPLLADAAAVVRPWRVVVEATSTAGLPGAWELRRPRAWHWMITAGEPLTALGAPAATAGRPGPQADVVDDAAARSLLQDVAPDSTVLRGHTVVERWIGSHEAGALVAVGALDRRHDGTGHLSGIATREDVRGRGHGTAVTVALTRAAVSTGPALASLGVWIDNEPAIEVYRRLAYRVAHSLVVGRVGG